MRDLFCMDIKDYAPDGKVTAKRPSVRAVIVRDDKALLVYSEKYDYYKFPGGGIEAGESHEDALLREVREETGRCVIRESIREFGRVLRRKKDDLDKAGIFEQENFYYFCEISDEQQETAMDAYEAEEGFTAVWVELFRASIRNRYSMEKGADRDMLEREYRVMDLLDRRLRDEKRATREAETIRQLGGLDYADMLSFVEETLGDEDTERVGSKTDIRYSRMEHTKRVLMWTKRLYDLSEQKEQLRYEDLIIAAIFHDVGRRAAAAERMPHAAAGVPITRQYLLAHGFDAERTGYICSLVGMHSDKYRMKEDGIDQNLLLLMEADLLDEMGALGIVMDCMITENRNPRADFKDCLDHIMRYTYRLQQDNPMVTPAAKKIWEEKTRLVEEFVNALKKDVEIEI